jgi:hypothetical protein
MVPGRPQRVRWRPLRTYGPRAPTGLDVFRRLFGLIDELSAEFATDPPCQPALAGAASRQYDGELRGNVEIFGDDLHASVRHVRDRTVARQQARPELDPRKASAITAFASASIHQHVDPSPCSIMLHPAFQTLLAKNYWKLPSGISRNVSIFSNNFYRAARTKAKAAQVAGSHGAWRQESGIAPRPARLPAASAEDDWRQDSSAFSMASNAKGGWKPASAVTLFAQSAKLAQRLRSNAQISANAASP